MFYSTKEFLTRSLTDKNEISRNPKCIAGEYKAVTHKTIMFLTILGGLYHL